MEKEEEKDDGKKQNTHKNKTPSENTKRHRKFERREENDVALGHLSSSSE